MVNTLVWYYSWESKGTPSFKLVSIVIIHSKSKDKCDEIQVDFCFFRSKGERMKKHLYLNVMFLKNQHLFTA